MTAAARQSHFALMRIRKPVATTALVLTLAACAAGDLSRIPDDALFGVPLPEFAPRVPDYRRVEQDGMFTERMGFRPQAGQGFAQFTYVLGPPGSFTPSDLDEARAPAALELAVRGDRLFAGQTLTFGEAGSTENRYGLVHWRRFSLPGHACAVLGQAFDEQSGLHGYYCLAATEPLAEEQIEEAAQHIVRRPLSTVGAILRQ